jgi:hypothetical protein
MVALFLSRLVARKGGGGEKETTTRSFGTCIMKRLLLVNCWLCDN